MIATISLYPLSKVSEREKKVKGRTFPANTIPDQLLCLNAGPQMQVYAERENMCCSCCVDQLLPVHKSPLVGEGREKSSNSNSSELCLSRFPWGPLSHELRDLISSKNMQRKALIFLLLEVLFLKTYFLSHERMSRSREFREHIRHAKHRKIQQRQTPPSTCILKISPSRSLTCTPAPLFLTLSRLSPSASSLPLHSPCLHTPLQERNRAREGVPNTDTFLLLLLLLTRPSRSKQQQ